MISRITKFFMDRRISQISDCSEGTKEALSHILSHHLTDVPTVCWNNPSQVLNFCTSLFNKQKDTLAETLKIITNDEDTDLIQFLLNLQEKNYPELTKIIKTLIIIANQEILSKYYHALYLEKDHDFIESRLPNKTLTTFFLGSNRKYLEASTIDMTIIEERSRKIANYLASKFVANPSPIFLEKLKTSFLLLKDTPSMLGSSTTFLRQTPEHILPSSTYPTTSQQLPFYLQLLLSALSSNTYTLNRVCMALHTLLNSNKQHVEDLFSDDKHLTFPEETTLESLKELTSWNKKTDFLSQFSQQTLISREFYCWLFHLNIQPESNDELIKMYEFFRTHLQAFHNVSCTESALPTLAQFIERNPGLTIDEATQQWSEQQEELIKDLPTKMQAIIKTHIDGIKYESSAYKKEIFNDLVTPSDEIEKALIQKLSTSPHNGIITALGIAFRAINIYNHSPEFFRSSAYKPKYEHRFCLSDNARNQWDVLNETFSPELKLMPSIREGLASKLHTLRSIAMTGDTLNHAFLLHARLTFKDPLFSHKTQNLAKKYITLASPEECTTLDFKAPVALNAFETFTTSALFGLFNVRVEDTKKAEQSLELATKIVTKLTGNAPNQVSAEPKTSTHLNWKKTFKGIRENFDFSQEIIKTDLLKTLYNTTKSKEVPYENPSNPIIYRYIIPAVLTIVGLTIFTSTFIPLMLSSLNWSVMSICMISLATTSFTLSVLGGFSYLNFHGSGLNHSIKQIKSWSFNADPAPPAAQPSIASKTAPLTFKGERLPSM